MSGLVNQSTVGSDLGSDNLRLVRACRQPESDGGTAITEAEAHVIEWHAEAVVAQFEELRLIDAACQQIRRRGVLAGVNERLRQDINAYRQLREGLQLTGQKESGLPIEPEAA